MVKDVFKVHWYWKRFNSAQDTEGIKIQKELEALLEQRKQARKSAKFMDLSPKTDAGGSRIVALAGGHGRSRSSGLDSRQGSGKVD